MATMAWDANHGAEPKMLAVAARRNARPMRDTADAIFATMAVLLMQMFFRAMLLMRRWNY
jgi:hypothetical protein